MWSTIFVLSTSSQILRIKIQFKFYWIKPKFSKSEQIPYISGGFESIKKPDQIFEIVRLVTLEFYF